MNSERNKTTKQEIKANQKYKRIFKPRINQGNNAKFVRMAVASLKLPPIDIRDSYQIADRCMRYLEDCVKDTIKPTVAGLCLYLGITTKTWANWQHGLTEFNTPEYMAVIQKIVSLFNSVLEQQLVDSELAPISGIFLLKNHFGYQDEKGINIQRMNKLDEPKTEEELIKEYINDVPQKSK